MNFLRNTHLERFVASGRAMLAAVAVSVAFPCVAAAPAVSAGRLLVVDQGDRALVELDAATGKLLKSLPAGGVTGHEIAVLPDHRTAVVPIYGDSGVGKPGTDGNLVSFFDLQSGKMTGQLNFGHGVRPHCVRYDPHTGMLYITTELDKTVSIVNPHTMRVVGTVPTGEPESHMLVLTRDGRRGYTANVHSGTLSVLDLAQRKVTKVVNVSPEVQRIALSPDERFVFTSDQTQPRLAVLDTANNTLTAPIQLPAIGYGITPTADGRWLLVALRTSGKVAVVDLAQRKVVHVLDVPTQPTEILVRPDGRMAYVSCGAAGKVAAIDTASWTVHNVFPAGGGADGLAWIP